MALLEACADRVPRRPIRAVVNTAEPVKPTVKGSKIAEPPRICRATPTTANRRAPSPAAPANRKPDAHRAAVAAGTWAGLGAQGRPAHVALDATAAGMRAALRQAAMTVAIFTNTWKTGLYPRHGESNIQISSRLNTCTDK